jgi:outer membrane protein TolC
LDSASLTENRAETAQEVAKRAAAEWKAGRPTGRVIQLAGYDSLSAAGEPAPELPEVLPPVAQKSPPVDPSLPDKAPVVERLPARLVHPFPADSIGRTSPLPPVGPGQAGNVREMDLSTALGIVSGQNPQIALAAQRYREAYARLDQARVLWLPSIHAGVSYNKHEGTLQGSDGTVFNKSRGALHTGLGVRASGTGSPPIPGMIAHFHLSDAVFQPRIANRAAAARQAAARATTHDVLLETAIRYLALLRASQDAAIAAETLEHAQGLANLTATFARSGQGPQADADRAQAALAVLRNAVTRAEEEVAVSSARLNELLRLDPTTTLLPREPTIVPVELVSGEEPLTELLATGLSNRPELAESSHLVGEAVQRYRREKYAPLLPSAFLAVSHSGFGGGQGSLIDNFDDRFDFDAAAYWELRNLGFGDGAAREEARARYEQARLHNLQVMDRVAREVIEAHAQVNARHRQIAVAESGIRAATDSYQRNMARIRAGEGLPIEVLQSIEALDQARREYLRAVVDHNEAQFRLHRALGWPIQ